MVFIYICELSVYIYIFVLQMMASQIKYESCAFKSEMRIASSATTGRITLLTPSVQDNNST